MEQEIIKGIGKALSSEFGSKYTVYTEKVKQGTEKPCFFIAPKSVCEIIFPMNRYFRENIFTVCYYPETENSNSECVGILERLYRSLEYIQLSDGPLKGGRMSCAVNGELLEFTVHYDMFVYKKREPIPKMERLNYRKNKKQA